ncbi:DUF642 domain-containing protein [Streptomyces sp. NPDC126514]|uniref:DUF642 domain-containing protein n=1 Tax=Streptomyces sp. NPDC126514 TaxID=3155210 RepID=UPI00333277CC
MVSRSYAGVVAAALLLVTASTSAAVSDNDTQVSERPLEPRPLPFMDGSFEFPRIAAESIQTYVAANVTFPTCPCPEYIGPWRVSQRTVDLYRNSNRFPAARGSQIVDLNGTNAEDLAHTQPGAITQRFATKVGVTYAVTYQLAANFDRPPVVKTGEVRVNDQVVQSFSFDSTGKTPQNMGWQKWRVTFKAVGEATTLTFASTTADGTGFSPSGPLIDDVKVKRVKVE